MTKRFLTQITRRAILFLTVSLCVPLGAFAQDVFPVTIPHALGTTIVRASPERIVTLGWSGEDAVIAMGKVPVAMPHYRFFPSGMFPWNEERIGATRPVLFKGDIDYEEIAALQPDLILGVYSGIDAVAYKRLSAIAPTVVYRSGPWQADWKEQTELIGQALGQSDKAMRLIAEASATLSRLGASQPVLQGKTFTFGTYFIGGTGLIVYLPGDPRVQALMELGMKPASGITALTKANPGNSSVTVGFEQISMIDADILVMWFGEGARAAAEAQPLFQELGVMKRGRYVPLEDPVEVWSTSALSVLSIPYGFPPFVSKLARAATRAAGE